MSVPGKPKPTLFELKTPKTDRMVVSEYNVWRPERTPDHVANVTMTSMERSTGLGKTLHLGTWTTKLADGIKSLFRASSIFPLGATPKPLEPTELRPIDDHSRTGLNAASSLEGLRHSLNAYTEISWFLQLDHFMRVSDVEGAFTILPLHPDVWPFFMFRFFSDSSAALQLFMHVCGDFGAAGMPGTF